MSYTVAGIVTVKPTQSPLHNHGYQVRTFTISQQMTTFSTSHDFTSCQVTATSPDTVCLLVLQPPSDEQSVANTAYALSAAGTVGVCTLVLFLRMLLLLS